MLCRIDSFSSARKSGIFLHFFQRFHRARCEKRPPLKIPSSPQYDASIPAAERTRATGRIVVFIFRFAFVSLPPPSSSALISTRRFLLMKHLRRTRAPLLVSPHLVSCVSLPKCTESVRKCARVLSIPIPISLQCPHYLKLIPCLSSAVGF